jgi:hypothetical protein
VRKVLLLLLRSLEAGASSGFHYSLLALLAEGMPTMLLATRLGISEHSAVLG